MDIDKMFKLPALPAGKGSKRKLPDLPSADVLKRFKADSEEASHPPTSDRRAATVEDEEDDRPFHAPVDSDLQGEQDDDDEDGRFFGGGLNEEQTHILDIFDQAGDEEGEPTSMSLPALRRLVGQFERVVSKNAEQRGKYPDDPTKFIESEADLDTMLKQFLPLTQNPSLYYPALISSGVVNLLANLLSHENTDIAIDVVEVLQELTDEDIGEDENDDAELENEPNDSNNPSSSAATRLALAELIDELLSHSIFELLVSNLQRLNEEEETDRQGVFHILGVFENLLTVMPPLAEQLGTTTVVLEWLLKRVTREGFDSNKQYASEILSMLLQQSANVEKASELEAVESLLMVIAQYRKTEPKDGEEQEFMENIIDCLCSLTSTSHGKDLFFKAEGVELMLIILKKKQLSSLRAIKVLDYALQTEAGYEGCERFVEMLGLKTLFSFFMGKVDKKKRHSAPTFEDDEHILGIIASLFANLPSDSPPRLRLVAKFVEADYEKVDRLLELRELAQSKMRPMERQIAANRIDLGDDIDSLQEEEWYLMRLDSGLSVLQTVDLILAWICMEDDGIKSHVDLLLARKSLSMRDIVEVLNERASYIAVDDEDEADIDPNILQQKVVLEGLINFLRGTL